MTFSELEYVSGDATDPSVSGPVLVCHISNDVGGWGRGFVLALSRRWPEPERCYRAWFAGSPPMLGELRTAAQPSLGEVQFVLTSDPSDIVVANMIAQHDIRPKGGVPPLRYEALASALSKVAAYAKESGRTVVMPRIGAGLAGGDWDRISDIIDDTLCAEGVRTQVYTLPS